MKYFLSLCIIVSLGVAKCIPQKAFEHAEFMEAVCWDCMYPLKVMGITTMEGSMQNEPVLSSFRHPSCACNQVPGVPVSFFEPSRMAEVVSDAKCSPFFGTKEDTQGTLNGTRGSRVGNHGKTFMQVHWYRFPVYKMLGVLGDFPCLEQQNLELTYMTETDATWQDDMLASVNSPEALLYGSPTANLACMTDSVSSTLEQKSTDSLFWCKGAWGNVYPMAGNTKTKNLVEDSASIAGTFVYKMHREDYLRNSFGTGEALCRDVPAPIWTKNAYRMQLLYPRVMKHGIVVGEHGLNWAADKNIYFQGDNFVWLFFKKRECCAR